MGKEEEEEEEEEVADWPLLGVEAGWLGLTRRRSLKAVKAIMQTSLLAREEERQEEEEEEEA